MAATAEPTQTPTAEPTRTPTAEPTRTPTAEPTRTPTAEPTRTPTAEPTRTPTAEPTQTPTAEPTAEPAETPAAAPTAAAPAPAAVAPLQGPDTVSADARRARSIGTDLGTVAQTVTPPPPPACAVTGDQVDCGDEQVCVITGTAGLQCSGGAVCGVTSAGVVCEPGVPLLRARGHRPELLRRLPPHQRGPLLRGRRAAPTRAGRRPSCRRRPRRPPPRPRRPRPRRPRRRRPTSRSAVPGRWPSCRTPGSWCCPCSSRAGRCSAAAWCSGAARVPAQRRPPRLPAHAPPGVTVEPARRRADGAMVLPALVAGWILLAMSMAVRSRARR